MTCLLLISLPPSYSTEYEQHVNPFNAFNARVQRGPLLRIAVPHNPALLTLQEKQRRIMSMPASDRITFLLVGGWGGA